MCRLHPELAVKLKALLSAAVVWNAELQCFVVDGVCKQGLTKLLAALMPVPRSKNQSADDDSSDAAVDVAVQRFGGSVLRRCGTCDETLKWLRSLDPLKYRIARRLRAEKDADKAHGIAVDYQLELYVRKGRAALFSQCLVVDPCVGTLLEQLDANEWSLIAAQVPIYDALSDKTTAIDLLATDKATRRELYLLEVKASRRTARDSNLNYERVRGTLKRSVLRGLPQSYLARAQMQLLWMNDSVERRFKFGFNKSLIMRVSPGVVRSYPLAAQFKARRADVAKAVEEYKKKRRGKRRKK